MNNDFENIPGQQAGDMSILHNKVLFPTFSFEK